MDLLTTVAPNVVQSIRAFRAKELQAEAASLGQHFLYAYCGDTTTKQQVLAKIATDFGFPEQYGKEQSTLFECLTHRIYKAGAQKGFVVVIEHLPNSDNFDREIRETLLDIFRDAADFWTKKNVAFRVFYSFELLIYLQ